MHDIALSLKSVQPHIGYSDISDMLETNMKAYYDWALLNIGAWVDVDIPTSGGYGGDYSRLRPVSDPLYTDGQVWEGARKDWAYETGVNYVGTDNNLYNPQNVGVPQINGSPATGAYHINYPQGRLVFDTPISQSSVVKLAHAYRYVQIVRANDAPWWRELQEKSFRVDSAQFLQTQSGYWSAMGEHRVQMPCIVIEVTSPGRTDDTQLGGGSLNVNRAVKFSILAETPSDRNKLMDIINLQVDKSLWLFNTNTMAEVTGYPLDYRGMLVGSGMYPNFISETGYRYATCRLADSTITDVRQLHPNLHMAVVRTTTETII